MKLYASIAAVVLAALLCGCSGDEPAPRRDRRVLKAHKGRKDHKVRGAIRARQAMEGSGR